MAENNIIKDKSRDFAIRIVRLYQYLSEEKREFVLSKQLLRSGTSIGANVNEALCGISKKDWKPWDCQRKRSLWWKTPPAKVLLSL